jgi:hypothetical protein
MGLKECIACSEDIKVEALLCKHCGTRQDDPEYADRLAEAVAKQIGDLGYPTESDNMPDTWDGCVEALEGALRDLGLTGAECSLRKSPSGKTVIWSEFGGMVSLTSTGLGGRWLRVFPPDPETGEEGFEDLVVSDFPVVSPRALAIAIVAWTKWELMEYGMDQAAMAKIMEKLGQPSNKYQLGTEYQAKLFTIASALGSAMMPEHWLSLEDSKGSSEAVFLSSLAGGLDKNATRKAENELDLTEKIRSVWEKLEPSLPEGTRNGFRALVSELWE